MPEAPRTSLKLSQQDVHDLRDMAAQEIGRLEKYPVIRRRRLLRYYRLRTRIRDADARLAGHREGRSAASS